MKSFILIELIFYQSKTSNNMGKQKQLLKKIITEFEFYSHTINDLKQEYAKNEIRICFKRSLNKSDLVRKILNEVVLSNDEKILLLRICFKKESEF